MQKYSLCPFVLGDTNCRVTDLKDGIDDKTLATCRDKFGNLPRFGGFPVPERPAPGNRRP